MSLTTDFQDGRIDKGDTKKFTVTPQDGDGNAITPSGLTLDIEDEDGTTTSYTLTDFTQSGDDYILNHTFDASGVHIITITVTDSNGNDEVVKGYQRVH